MAMLHLRYYPPARRDLSAARHWVEKAAAFTHARPASTDKKVNLAFLLNTRALVEMKEGRVALAIRLLDEAIAFLESEAPEAFAIESPILYRNRATLHLRNEDSDRAIADLTAAVRHDWGFSSAHLELAILLRRRGRYAEALERSNDAIAWSPPWTNAYHQRALIYTDLGRSDEALIDYERVLTLDPDHVDALSDRATLLYRLQRYDPARADVERGLSLGPIHARLLCLRGYLERREGRIDDACRSFAAALERKPPLPDAVAAAVRGWLAVHAPAVAGHADGNIPRLS
jgi:tetratricopeptide (TPR) repeat protein